MNQEEIYNIYVYQSKNVRKLKKVYSNLLRTLNHYLIKNDEFQIEINTKLLALLYSTLSEAQFIQIVHTPNGFIFSEIERIKSEKEKYGIVKAWELVLEIAFEKVNTNWKTISDLSTRHSELKSLIEKFIQAPSELRNKIAHGQWEIALNRKNTDKNDLKTNELSDLNVNEIEIWANVHQYLAQIIRDLLQSPQVAFHNFYWKNLTDLQNFISLSSNWTMEKRIEKLRPKNYD